MKKAVWCGCDVGKKTFVASLAYPEIEGIFAKEKIMDYQTRDFPNTENGVESLLLWIDRCNENFSRKCTEKAFFEDMEDFVLELDTRLVMESTGNESRRLEGYLLEKRAELRMVIENPALIKSFIKSLNIKNKTDNLDARAIARFGLERTPEPKIKKGEIYEHLCDLSRYNTFLSNQITALKNQHDTLRPSMLKTMDTEIINTFKSKKDQLEREIKKVVAANPEIRQDVEIMSTMPGVATISAASLLGELGSLRNYSTRTQLTAMAGLNPVLKLSGSSVQGNSKISKQGSPRARQTLYLISLHAVNKDLPLTEFHARLVSNGKTPMAARCACMRKILLMLRSMVINNQSFRQNIEKKENFND